MNATHPTTGKRQHSYFAPRSLKGIVTVIFAKFYEKHFLHLFFKNGK